MPNLGMGELLVVLVIVVLIFGVNKIPQLGKGLGEGIKNFKSAIKAAEEEPDKSEKKQA
jgi:sec-independent protein translocase protein TatA